MSSAPLDTPADGVRSSKIRPRALLALLALLTFTLWGSAAPAQAYDEDTVVALVNESRWAGGSAGLLRNAEMDQVALAWAERLADSGTLSHNPDYASQIPGGWTRAGENVASGYASASSMHEGWMNSPGHRANVLGDYTDIGVAYIDAGGSTWGVQVFAKYPGHSGPAAPAPAPPVEEEPAPAPAPVEPATPVETPTPTPTQTPAATPTPTPTPTATPSPAAPTPTATRDAPLAAASANSWVVPVIVATVLAILLAAAAITWLILLRRKTRPAEEWPKSPRRRSLGR